MLALYGVEQRRISGVCAYLLMGKPAVMNVLVTMCMASKLRSTATEHEQRPT